MWQVEKGPVGYNMIDNVRNIDSVGFQDSKSDEIKIANVLSLQSVQWYSEVSLSNKCEMNDFFPKN